MTLLYHRCLYFLYTIQNNRSLFYFSVFQKHPRFRLAILIYNLEMWRSYCNMKIAAWNYDDLWLGSAFSNGVFNTTQMDIIYTLLGFIGRDLSVFLMSSRCFPMPSRYFPMPFRCLPDALPMLCVDIRFEYLPNTFPIFYEFLPHIISFKSLPNSFVWIPSQLFFFQYPPASK